MIIGSINENINFEKRVSITPDIIKKYKSPGTLCREWSPPILGKSLHTYSRRIKGTYPNGYAFYAKTPFRTKKTRSIHRN